MYIALITAYQMSYRYAFITSGCRNSHIFWNFSATAWDCKFETISKLLFLSPVRRTSVKGPATLGQPPLIGCLDKPGWGSPCLPLTNNYIISVGSVPSHTPKPSPTPSPGAEPHTRCLWMKWLSLKLVRLSDKVLFGNCISV